MKNILIAVLFLFFSCGGKQKEKSISIYQQWDTVTLSFEGPETSEKAVENPFLNYRLIVEFKHENTQQVVRGFYAADGNASETSTDSGNVWQVRFTPDQVGKWGYIATLYHGDSIALNDKMSSGSPIQLENSIGEFNVIPSDKKSPDFRAKGRLGTSKGYYQFLNSGEYWIKGGANSPENLLAYEDFDGTFRMEISSKKGESSTTEKIHEYLPHLKDWQKGDPIWKNGKGKGLIGAANYLASKGMNSVYFLSMNIEGDGKDVWPYATPDDFTRFDVSKLEQWEIVFQHMQSKGLNLHMVLQETENETLLDGGEMGPMRQLYLRELIARFGHHLALSFNIGEENGPALFSPVSQNDAQRKAMIDFITKIDPYNHPILLHTHSHDVPRDPILDSILGFKNLDGLSLQSGQRTLAAGVMEIWKNASRDSGHEWLIAMDEVGMWHTGAQSDSITPNHDTLRGDVLWGTLLSGGAGVEWYFGARNKYHDLNTEDWSSRNRLWELTAYAMDFFQKYLPYYEMVAKHDLVDINGAYCFQKEGEIYAVYLPDSSEHTLNLEETQNKFKVHWFDPLAGGELQLGSLKEVQGGKLVSLGLPPSTDQDWVVLLNALK